VPYPGVGGNFINKTISTWESLAPLSFLPTVIASGDPLCSPAHLHDMEMCDNATNALTAPLPSPADHNNIQICGNATGVSWPMLVLASFREKIKC